MLDDYTTNYCSIPEHGLRNQLCHVKEFFANCFARIVELSLPKHRLARESDARGWLVSSVFDR